MQDAMPAWPDEVSALQKILVTEKAPEDPQAWEKLLPYAREHNLLPLLRKKLGGSAAVPEPVRAIFQREYMRSAARATLLQRDLARMLEQFRAKGIEIILLKGSALAAAIYPDPALRPMVDVDALIAPQDAPAAIECAQALGFYPQNGETRAGDQLEFENEAALINPASAMGMIEFHWSLFNSPHHQQRLQMNWFRDTAIPIHLNATPAKMLSAEAQLIHLSSHLMLHHRGYGLLWWNDIFELLRKYEAALNWDIVLSKAREFDLILPLQEVVLRLRDEWGAPVPPAALDGLRAATATPREAQVYEWLTAPERPVAQRFAADLRGLTSWRARLRFALSNLFPSAQYMRSRYRIKNNLLVPLAYPYRWLVGAASAIKRK
ncbi:MAG TPA: nucleotidyltransferase family protein [Thermoflexales bacterium]|nr:nucleotidyltransferase family protein [Thermoflexales bacterium]HRA00180.1 nucleotidyltransferase family protein [Thermoflexales bacterium]